MNYKKLITKNPKTCGGQLVLKGTRVTVKTVLASLASGDTPEKILKEYPSLKKEHVHAVIRLAASLANDDLPFPGLPFSL